MEIITAGDGTAHVSSADDGTIYAGIVGNECYVTGVGDKLSCTMQGANTALVGTGAGIMYGRAFRVAMPEEVTIQSGTQSQRRHDVICAHFTTSSDGHESGELVVLKGTPTSGQEAEDPEIPSGSILEGATEAYMPLWRIPLDGINVGEPEAMFDVLTSMADLRDSVSRMIQSGKKKVTPRSDGWAMVWTYDQFVSEFGIDPAEATIVFCNYASGYSSIWPEPAVVDADKTVWSLIVWRTGDGWVASISEPTEIPIRYTVIS